MNLRSAKASEPNVPEEATPDPRQPHNFHEVHIDGEAQADAESPNWG